MSEPATVIIPRKIGKTLFLLKAYGQIALSRGIITEQEYKNEYTALPMLDHLPYTVDIAIVIARLLLLQHKGLNLDIDIGDFTLAKPSQQ